MGIYLKGIDYYPVLVMRTGTMFEASFLDMPGCRAYGATRDEAEANSRCALNSYAATMGHYGRPMPKPSIVSPAIGQDLYIAYIEGPESLSPCQIFARRAG